MHKFLTGILVITLVAIAYVFQQAKLLECSYLAYSYNKSATLLVDRNSHLRYNVLRLEGPARLESVLLAKTDKGITMPRRWHKIKVEEDAQHTENMVTPIRPFINAGRILLSMFSLDTEAVARELSE